MAVTESATTPTTCMLNSTRRAASRRWVSARWRTDAPDAMSSSMAEFMCSMLRSRTHKHLLSDWLDRAGKPRPDQERLHRETALHRKGHKAGLNMKHVVAIGGEEVGEADMRVNGLVVEVVEILAEGVPIVGLDDRQRATRRQLAPQRFQHGGKLLLGKVLEQIAGKGEIDCAIVQKLQVGDAADLVFD